MYTAQRFLSYNYINSYSTSCNFFCHRNRLTRLNSDKNGTFWQKKREIMTEKKNKKNGEVRDPLAQSLAVQNSRTRKECTITSYNLVLKHEC